MNFDEPISDDELRQEFDKISDIFCNGTPEQKFNATGEMLRLMSRHFSSTVPGRDCFPLTALLSDLATIESGREPSFLKTHQNVEGKNPDPRIHMYYACISAAVIILRMHGYKLVEAERYVAKIASLKPNQVRQIRSDFGHRDIIEDVHKYYVQQINLEFQTTNDAEKHIFALVTPILKILNK